MMDAKFSSNPLNANAFTFEDVFGHQPSLAEALFGGRVASYATVVSA